MKHAVLFTGKVAPNLNSTSCTVSVYEKYEVEGYD